jgi:hypothetical protein
MSTSVPTLASGRVVAAAETIAIVIRPSLNFGGCLRCEFARRRESDLPQAITSRNVDRQGARRLLI